MEYTQLRPNSKMLQIMITIAYTPTAHKRPIQHFEKNTRESPSLFLSRHRNHKALHKRQRSLFLDEALKAENRIAGSEYLRTVG